MKKGLLFDLDGVLVDSKETHFKALNLALQDINNKYVITDEEQRVTYEGLSTKNKLIILNATKGLPEKYFEKVWELKQEYTAELFQSFTYDADLVEIFKYIKTLDNMVVGVVSNSIRKTLNTCINNLGISKYVDISVSNEEVSKPKPDPAPYILAMRLAGLSSESVVIFEDSIVGRASAVSSGAHLVPIENRLDLTKEKVDLACQMLHIHHRQ